MFPAFYFVYKPYHLLKVKSPAITFNWFNLDFNRNGFFGIEIFRKTFHNFKDKT